MIGVVVVSHGHLADEFVAAAEHVLGPQSQMRAVPIGPDDDMEARRADIIEAVRLVDDGSGVIVLTDMFGGTPSNLAISVLSQGGLEVIAGVNLPMLIKLGEIRGRATLQEAAAKAQEAGRHYIRIASAELDGGA
ncbi:MAG: PTS sugar transporter subunit IIA [Hyphomonadaceae bacterium]|jgi:PTS system mannose-specific IIA component|nr:PTS sugar transporter subunit IIA [Hyphomonadaceae bacterium]